MVNVARSRSSVVPIIAHQYGWTVERITPCSSYYLKHAAYRTETNVGTVVIKPFRGSPRRLREVYRLAHRLERHSYPHMPTWYKTLHDKRFVEHEGVRYYANEWIHGRPLGDKREDLFQLGVSLATLHALRLRNTHDPHVSCPTRTLELQHQRFVRNLSVVEGEDSDIGRWYAEHGHECMDLAATAIEQLQQADVRCVIQKDCDRPVIIHGDVTRPNTIITASGAVLIDWERISFGVRYVELARALANTTDFRRSRIKSVLDGYESVYPLSPAERRAVAMYFRFPREAWYVADPRANGAKDEAFELLSTMWSRRMRAVRYLENWAD